MNVCVPARQFVFFLEGVLLSLGAGISHAQTENNYYYTVSNQKATIVNFNYLYSGGVSIPNTLGGCPVVDIGDGAFYCAAVTDIAIPSSVTNIGNGAFVCCGALTNISIPESVTRIGASAFEGCISLTSVTIPNDVTNLADYLFDGCTLLTNVTVSSNVAAVGYGAFEFCGSLTDIRFLNQVRTVGPRAFGNCQGLTNIVIPDAVTGIGDEAFANCSSLTTVVIPASVSVIGSSVFTGCSALSEFSVDPLNPCFSSADSLLFDKGQTVLYLCGKNKSGRYDLPGTFAIIEAHAFADCDKLTGVTLPDGVVTIGDEAFIQCDGLTALVIPKSITSIGARAFMNCANLAAFTVDALNPAFSSWNGILFNKDQSALIQCPGNHTGGGLALPAGVTRIGDGAFCGCRNLTGVEPPDCVTNIGNGAFAGCTQLTRASVPDGVRLIGPYTFENCYSLTDLTIGNGVTNIQDRAFENCGSLVSVTLPSGLACVGSYAFLGCAGLTAVYFNGNAPHLTANAFFCGNQTTVYCLPGTSDWVSTLGNRPIATWQPRIRTAAGLLAPEPSEFAFDITWGNGRTVVVETCTNLLTAVWSALDTNTLDAAGSLHFGDPADASIPVRFYRVRGF